MSTLSVLILAKDEEKNIADAIASVRFAGEVLVIDSGSTDRTAEIARSAGARVLSHPMGADGFAGQRNFAQEQASGDWVLYLDADERVLPELATAVQEHIAQGGRRAGRQGEPHGIRRLRARGRRASGPARQCDLAGCRA